MSQPMPKQTAKDFHPEVLKLFDQYVHGGISRRGFLSSAGKYAAGAVTAEGLLSALSPNFAMTQQVKQDDARILASYVEYPSPYGYGTLRGYLVKPANAKGRLPTVLVVHENRGLNPHIEDVARRVALDNFIAFAPDALFPLGGYPGTEDKARELFPKLDQAKTREDFITAAGVKYQAYIYDGVEHGFNNDTTPRFDAAAAKLAWSRTIKLFNRTLRTVSTGCHAPQQRYKTR